MPLCKYNAAMDCGYCGHCPESAQPQVKHPCSLCGGEADYGIPAHRDDILICGDCWRDMSTMSQMELVGAKFLNREDE